MHKLTREELQTAYVNYKYQRRYEKTNTARQLDNHVTDNITRIDKFKRAHERRK